MTDTASRAPDPIAVVPERPASTYEPSSQAPPASGASADVAAPGQTPPVPAQRSSADARRREAEGVLTDTLAAVLEAIRKPKKQAPVEAPSLLSLGSLTLLFVAVDLALVIYLSDKLFPPAFAGAVSKALSAALGVGAIAYLDQIRTNLFLWCQRWRFRALVVTPMLLWLPSAIPYRLELIAHRPAKVVVVGAKVTWQNDSILTASVRGFQPARLVVQEAHSDTFDLTRADMIAAAFHTFFPVLRLFNDSR